MLAAGVDRDDIICENVIKMGMLAQSAQCNGVSTMLANLSTSFTNVFEREKEQASAVLELSKEGIKSAMRLPLMTKGPQRTKIRKDQSWLEEYYRGAGKEMYLIRISKVRFCEGLLSPTAMIT